MTKKRQEEENIKDDITLDLYELCEEDEVDEDEEEIEDEGEIEDEPIEDEAEANSDKEELKDYYSNLL